MCYLPLVDAEDEHEPNFKSGTEKTLSLNCSADWHIFNRNMRIRALFFNGYKVNKSLF